MSTNTPPALALGAVAGSGHRGLLDWAELLNRLAARAQSASGAAVCRALPLLDSAAAAGARMALVSEMVNWMSGGQRFPSLNFPDIDSHLNSAETGEPLGAEELKQVVDFCEVAASAKRALATPPQGGAPQPVVVTPALAGLTSIAARLGVHDDLVVRAKEIFDSSGEIRDNASPELQRLRRQREQLGTQARQDVERLLHSEEFAPYLQDQFVTLREDRFVLPLRASYKSMGLGIVHDTSRTGETVFVEPSAMVGVNNRLKVADIDIRRECRRILEELAGLVAAAADSLRRDAETLTELDVLAAQARLSLAYGGVPVAVVDEPIIQAPALRHPLLALRAVDEKFGVTPNDFTLGKVPDSSGASVLVISGPNAGGKTVLLKAVGMAALLARAGMHVPAAPGTRIGFFDGVLADIGDQQSVLGDLSTFSAHLANLAGILEAIRQSPQDRMLVLCDELMAGTHPEQGAALARAVLEALADCHGLVVATTHYDSLKALTDGDARFRNAGMEYDLARLRPTFRLKDGLPGRSYALDIATRMGLPEGVLQRARALLGSTAAGLESVLATLQQREEALAQSNAALQAARDDWEAQVELQRQAVESLSERERALAKNTRVAVDDAVRQARAALSEIVREARQARSLSAVVAARQTLEQAAKAATASLPDPESLDVDRLRQALANRALGVSSGKTAKPYRAPPPAAAEAPLALQTRANSVDVRGMRADEALRDVQAYLDKAVMEAADTVFVIHGHGTGVLRRLVREYLATSPYVSQFRPGGPREGGDGVSVVTVKG